MKKLSHEERIEVFQKRVGNDNMLGLQNPSGKEYEKLTQVLDEDYGYFDCPASLKHHGNCDGGLFEHSMAVAENLESLLLWNHRALFSEDYDTFDSDRDHYVSLAYRVGLFHDICKCVQYIQSPDGTWHWNENCIWNGHGSLSVMLTQKIFEQCGIPPLSFEELACIRWHMGAFDEKENWGFYTKAIKEYPTVLWTHTADMIASQIDEK